MMAKLDKIEAVQRARQLVQKDPVYLDTETTGTGPTAEIIEIAVVDQNGSVLFESLVKPKGQIEPEAMRVHGITPDRLVGAPTWQDIWPQVEAVLAGRLVGVYNSEFDLRMLKQSHRKYWLNWQFPEENFFCIMKLYARFYGEWDARRGSYRWQSLDLAGQQCRIPLPNSHRAQDDARLARALLQHIAAADVS
jgi:DNA polymerase-3 subunit epsilon